jgi:hypothetical protein
MMRLAAGMSRTQCSGKYLAISPQNYLSNRVFKDQSAILDARQTAWRRLLNEPGRIASIATRDWPNIGQSL